MTTRETEMQENITPQGAKYMICKKMKLDPLSHFAQKSTQGRQRTKGKDWHCEIAGWKYMPYIQDITPFFDE